MSSALFVALLLGAACGGGGKDEPSVFDPNNIATATLPNPLPDAVILGENQVPGTSTTYITQSGDTLSAIAAQFGVTVEAIMEANNITDPTSLIVGVELIIPGVSSGDVLAATEEPPPVATEAPPDTQPPAGGQTYIVQEGDIPETIAAQFGITADELMAANGITDPTSLQVGQELIIPEPSGG